MLQSVPVHFATVTVFSTVSDPYKNNEHVDMTNLLLYQRIAQQLADDIRRGVYQP
ncbi:MAG: PLP-dependent aminotransferase family protein, partial [Pseudomonas alloputida]